MFSLRMEVTPAIHLAWISSKTWFSWTRSSEPNSSYEAFGFTFSLEVERGG